MASVPDALTQAVEHHQNGRLEAAAEIYQNILRADANQPDALHLLGVIAHQVGRHETAVDLIGRAVRIRGDAAFFHNNLGEAYQALKRFPKAVACYRRALELMPQYAGAHNNLGNALKGQGKLDEAANCYRRAVELKPEYADAHYNLANVLREQEKLDEAVACYRRAVELKPDHAAAHANLGNTLNEQGKPDEAVASLRRALELKPDYAEAHGNLGVAYKKQGKREEALACWRRALELKPDFPEAHANLGNALREQGKFAEAAASCRRAVELNPDSAAAHAGLGNALREQGNFEEALGHLCRAVQLNRRRAEAHLDLGNLLKEQGKFDAAEKCYRRALELEPEDVNVLASLGHCLQKHDKPDEALAQCRRAVELRPDNADAHYFLGSVWKDQGRLDEALPSFRRALELRPNFVECLGTLGSLFEEQGNLREAEEAYRAALRHNPGYPFAHSKLAQLLRGKLGEEEVAAQQRLLAETDLTDAQRYLLHYGLASVRDAHGDYAAAAEHLAQANALQRADFIKRGQPYRPDTYESLAARLMAACTPEFFQRVRGFGHESELPVFVVGLPRSGTTLVEQVMAGHSRVFAAGEIKLAGDTLAGFGSDGSDPVERMRRMDRPAAFRAAERHLEKLRALAPAADRIVDKMPDNYLHLGVLAALLPRAKFIHCRRDLRDVAVSCWMTPFEEVRWANNQDDIAARFRVYRQIMDHWQRVLPVPVLDVDYEEIVADLEGAARRLIDFCHLPWEPRCLEFHRSKRPVSTASAVQVRQPVYKTSIQRWRNYRPYLAPLFARLERESILQARGIAVGASCRE